MPKYRQLHTKIIDSFDFNEMPDDFARVTWMLLTLMVDSEGRGINNMAWLKSKIYPLREDVTLERLTGAFNWLVERKMILCYAVNGRQYFFIPTFKNYQTGTEREAKSLLPPPSLDLLATNSEETQEQVCAAESASASVNESASVIESTPRQKVPIGVAISSFGDNVARDAEKLYREVTGQMSIPSDQRDKAIPDLIAILDSYAGASAVADGKQVFATWCSTQGKNGRKYSPTNTAWTGKWLEKRAPIPAGVGPPVPIPKPSAMCNLGERLRSIAENKRGQPNFTAALQEYQDHISKCEYCGGASNTATVQAQIASLAKGMST